MKTGDMSGFLASVRKARLIEYLEPIGESGAEALERRLRWARRSKDDARHMEEAAFLLTNVDALRAQIVLEEGGDPLPERGYDDGSSSDLPRPRGSVGLPVRTAKVASLPALGLEGRPTNAPIDAVNQDEAEEEDEGEEDTWELHAVGIMEFDEPPPDDVAVVVPTLTLTSSTGGRAAPSEVAPIDSGPRRFRLSRRLGGGVNGDVFFAARESSNGRGRPLALKILRVDDARGVDEASQRLRLEAARLARLAQPSIVVPEDLVLLEGHWSIVMEVVPGWDLRRLVLSLRPSGVEFPGPAALQIGAALADAMAAVEAANQVDQAAPALVHRNIKPSNVMVTRDGAVRLLDFGLGGLNVTEPVARAGVSAEAELYMAPERLLRRDAGLPADVYAIAVIVAELITLQPAGVSPANPARHAVFVEDLVGCVVKRVSGPPSAIGELADLLRQSLYAEPQDRPTAREQADAFARLAGLLHGDGLRKFSSRPIGLAEQMFADAFDDVDVVLSEGGGAEPTAEPTAVGRQAMSMVASLALIPDVTGAALFVGAEMVAARMPVYVNVAGLRQVVASFSEMMGWVSSIQPCSFVSACLRFERRMLFVRWYMGSMTIVLARDSVQVKVLGIGLNAMELHLRALAEGSTAGAAPRALGLASTTDRGAGGVTAAVLETVAVALARYLGPVARRVVRLEVEQRGGREQVKYDDLVGALSAKIQDSESSRAFLQDVGR